MNATRAANATGATKATEATKATRADTPDAYIAACAPEVQGILQRIREIVRRLAPDAQEKISYRMPAFTLDGDLIYYAAFRKHIGIYPPVQGDAALRRDLAPYRNERGNLAFPLDAAIPYELIERVAAARLQEHRALLAAKAGKQAAKKAAQKKEKRARAK
ncbi:iron chaperone [Uliginosibacterium sp. H1]|uniref:iron chaperone n=1 Tax=Uliginosibacterium sp. H1 TaxID=3114757 RepID=UPI002E184061|nr:DUF1801 domain-containing protein [Uliginosibacterium sp. H1]